MLDVQHLGSRLRFSSHLPAHLFELTVLVVARHRDQSFEWSTHAPLALRAGLSQEVVTQVAAGSLPHDVRDPRIALVGQLVHELVARRRINRATAEAAVSCLGTELVLELTTCVGYYTLLAMVMDVAEVEAPDGPDARSPRHLTS